MTKYRIKKKYYNRSAQISTAGLKIIIKILSYPKILSYIKKTGEDFFWQTPTSLNFMKKNNLLSS